ncbi:chemotaxis regulatory protein ChePep [Helicobacter pylori]|uniref:chemotaxis regulatory protein ChePep n=1 Tax=Helicobacter pylori TaxID=210 RepID=UPI002AC5DE2D|nr:chemotaxis regulatory protein ChePep [Helicobacter pylori]MDZ5287640.1 chemotaxis regulatory protein ChePep [Helicobacter pylori]
MKMILFNQNPMIAKLLESVSKKLELSIENFNHYQELSAHLKEDPEWLLIADDECLEKLDQVDWLELKEIISQNKNSVCMYKKGNEAQPFLEGFEMKIKKPFLPTEVLKILQKKLGSNASELEPSQNLDPTQEVLETNWDELENLGDLEALAKEEPNNEEQLLPTLNDQEEKEEIKKEEKEEIKETPQEEEKPKDDETQEGETPKDEEVSKELETQEELEIPKEKTQEEQVTEQEPIKEETQEIKEEKQEETQDSPSVQELEAMQELVKEIQENSNGQEDKKETQENAETPQEKETQELEIPKEEIQEETQEAVTETPQTQESTETPQEKEKQEDTGTPQELEIPQVQEKETPQEETQETQEKEMPQTQDEKPQEDHYESIEDIPEPVMAKAMGEELPFLNEAVAKTPNNENATETPKESVTEISKNENATETPQEEESDKTSSPLELHLNLQDLLKSLNQESLKSLLENKTLSIKITLEDKKPDA